MITINQHNYEQYFLLWVDGELSPEEKVAVERFMLEHPDLADELALLQDTILVPEEQIIFNGKDQLLKQSTNEITLSNYETWFLLFIDNELTPSDREKVELFILQHPNLQAAFELLVQTKLAPEEWVFNNKEVLYRKEEQKRPVVYMRWMRYASAAAVIGLIATVWMLAPTNQLKTTIEINGTQPEMLGTEPVNNAEKRVVANEETLKSIVVEVDPKASVQTEKPYSNIKADQPIISNNSLVTIINDEPAKKEEHVIAKVENNPIATNKAAISDNLIVGRNDIENNQGANIEPAETKSDAAFEEAKPVYTALEDAEEDKSLFIGALEINKDKLRGLFRKAGTIFRSKAKQEEDTRQKK
ncbi:anti-sigma factor [Sediminibacterium sp.]|uniref:anti-sigma factor family protein n=1 Tax=Sediminibacterium sp. TaxID=1917865 RepID=UPI0027364787|nr:hypothetical protein [Sediminibacterium sp.]MDP3393457.1 hypothetical protein [Sediminibacterium sp.]MDP3568059.1 hypothetical protein [Sediminibacterium sp.]